MWRRVKKWFKDHFWDTKSERSREIGTLKKLMKNGMTSSQTIKFVEDCAAFMDRFTRLESILRDMDTELPGVADHNYVDIALLPEIKKVLSIRYDQEISEAEWTNLRQVILAAFLRWRKDMDLSLAVFVPELTCVYRSLDTLDYPATLFWCCKCSDLGLTRAVTYVDMISHRCCNEPFDFDSTSCRFSYSYSDYHQAAVFYFWYNPWSYHCLKFHSGSYLVVDSVVTRGEHGCRASRGHIDSLRTQFKCIACTKNAPWPTADWPDVVQHVLTHSSL
ncbi:hypothetical protein HETIRDRAFT_419079 [Heterobasidion irregulare TC 32-1]|uniref:Uncharacterized protein n=1 Tax=Heterobasidion irregulare (strain TC 32-1) TaxID=747525 RepID=W4K5X3_HETIT|nr:uncharacterized protein HETIRDRAFT_419079 [Heterobasidion irregulare TC 32-1]ETW81169.1 hypothetical protein HETIRDRAFT_419079 [Heterobasidion irregulare TC 32-1]